MKKRLKYIDIAKGISILLVILGHCLPENNIFRQYIYTFHMPLFFIISGIFYKKLDVKEQLKKDIKLLIIPYCITSLIIIAIKTVAKIGSINNMIRNFTKWAMAMLYGSGDIDTFMNIHIEPIGTIWFLLSLFWIRFIFNLIMKIDRKYLRVLIIVILNIIGFILPKIVWLPLSLETAFIAINFYYVGYILNNKKMLDRINGKVFAICFIIWIIGSKFIVTYCVNNYYNLYYLNIIIGIIGTINVIYLCKKIESIKYINDILSWIGKNSLYILCIHGMEGRGIIPWNIIIKKNNTFILIIRRITFALVMTVIYKNIKNMIGKKNEKFSN